MKPGDTLVVEARELDALFGALRERGHTLLGPTVRDGAIVLAEIGGASDLPAGWTDEQDGGRYRLRMWHQATVHPDRTVIGVQAAPGWRVEAVRGLRSTPGGAGRRLTLAEDVAVAAAFTAEE